MLCRLSNSTFGSAGLALWSSEDDSRAPALWRWRAQRMTTLLRALAAALWTTTLPRAVAAACKREVLSNPALWSSEEATFAARIGCGTMDNNFAARRGCGIQEGGAEQPCTVELCG